MNISKMTADATEISKLATILRQNGDKVLNALSKLSLNATLLQKLNKEFQSVVQSSNEEDANTFQVLTTINSNSQLTKDLQFLHDFLQKTVGLKLTNHVNLSLLSNKIDLSKFKNIRYLEIKKIPIKEIIGLKVIQSQLESIICSRCLSMLEELLAECGGDNSSGFVWSELKEAVLSYNSIKIVDTSLAFAPWLQVLDLSHNQITDVKAIECLPNLKYINLSFNCLDVIPTFSKSARKKLQVLVMKNNYVEDLAGLNGLDYLTELDLSCNWVSSHEVLYPLLSMSTLQWLSLEGNPISFHSSYRRNTVGYLHISASFGDFVLDRVKLTKQEKSTVGIKLCEINRSTSSSHTTKSSKESSHSKPPDSDQSEVKPNTVRKSGKVRLAVIPNLDDGTYEEIPTDISSSFLFGSSTEHLITKKRIENTRAAFGSDNWLRCQAGSVVQDILGLPSTETLVSSTPYDDLCLAAAMESLKKNVITTTAVIENQTNIKTDHLADKNNLDSFISCEDNGSNYFSIENSTDKVEAFNSNVLDNVPSKETSPDIERIRDSEEEIEEEGEKLYSALKEIKLGNNETKQEEIFLSVSETELKEKELQQGKTITKWSLSSLESCIKLSLNKIQLAFDTIRRDKKSRTYELDPSEAQILYKYFSEFLDRRSFSEMNQVVYRCVNCSAEFSKERRTKKSDNTSQCPFCNSKVILEVDEVTLPSSVNEKQTKNKINETKKIEVKASHNRSSSAGVIQTMTHYDEKMIKCSSQSSIGSAASLEELGELPAIQNSNVKRSDSDIEILSNPSQSSIEVIDGPTRLYGGSTPRRKRSSEERQVAPAQLVVPEKLCHVNSLTGLTESSSSGSITDSVCTAYENNSMVTSVISKTDHVDVVVETAEETVEKMFEASKNFKERLEEVIENVSAKIPKQPPKGVKKIPDIVRYSYTDFSNVDHRIKLFLYAHVFEDNNEELEYVLRSTVLLANLSNPFPSCVVGSNKKLYILKVTGAEQGDEASKFLQKADSLCYNLNQIKSIYTLSWRQGLGVKVQEVNDKSSEFLLYLKDPTRTRNFLSFLTSAGISLPNNCKIVRDCSERALLAIQHLLLSGASEDTNVLYFCLFAHCTVFEDPDTKEIKHGGVLVTASDLLIFADQLKWFLDGSDENPNPTYTQKLSDLMQVTTDGSKIILYFLNELEGKEESWSLMMETGEAMEELLNSLKSPWEKMFSVPLHVVAS